MNFYKTFFTLFFIFQFSSLFAVDSNINLTVHEKDFLAKHKTIKVSNVLDWAPYDYNIDGIPKGYSVDYMKLLANKIGIELEFVANNWKNSLEDLENKKIDIIHTISKSDKKRLEYTLFTKPYLNIRYSLITQNNSKIKTLDDLKNKKIALVKGWTSTKYIKENYPDIEVIEKDTSKEMLTEVAFGQVDAAIDDFVTANYFINKEFLNNLSISSKLNIPDSHNILHIGVRNDWNILKVLIDKAIDNVTEEELLKLNNRWMMKGINNLNRINFTTKELDFIKAHPIVSVGGEMDWPPFDYVENGKYQGIAKDYLDLIEKYSGLKFDVKTGYTWDQLLTMAKNKELDVMPMIYHTKEREEFFNYTDKYLTVRNYLYTLEDKSFLTLEELSGKTIAFPKGFAQIELLKKQYPKIKILETTNTLESIDAVVTKKADALIENIALVTYLIKKHNIEDIKSAFSINLGANEIHMTTRKDWTILRDIIQKSINKISIKERNIINRKWMQLDDTNAQIRLNSQEREFIVNHPVIKVGGETDWPPFDYVENGEYRGIGKDYLKLIEKYTGLKFDIKTGYTWNELLGMAKDKQLDMLPMIYYSKDREKFLNFTHNYLNVRNYLYTLKSTQDYNTLEDLNGKTIAVPKGFAQAEIIRRKYPEIKILEAKNVLDSIDAVVTKKADGFIENTALVSYLLKKHNIRDIKGAFSIKIGVNKLYMATRKDWSVLRDIIQKGLDKITIEEKEVINERWLRISDGKKLIKFSSNEREYIENNTVRCVTTTSWAPFNTREDGDSKPVGVALDYWQLIIQNTGLKTTCDVVDKWDDVLNAIKNNEADITLATTITKEKGKFTEFSKPYASFPIVIATQNDKGYISDASYLEGKKVAVGRSYSAYEILKEHYPSIDFVEVKNIDKALELLSQNKVDAVVDILPVLAYKMNVFGYANLKISGTTKFNFDLRMMMSKDNKELLSIVNKGIDTISDDEKKLIYNKWISIKIDQGFDYSLFWKVILAFVVVVSLVLYRNRQLVKYQKDIQKKNNELEFKNNELKNAKENLKETLNGFQTMINSTLEGIFILKESICIDVNDVAVELLGYDNKEQIIGKSAFEFIAPESIELVKEKIALSEAKPYEVKVLKKDGTKFDCLIRGKNIILNGKYIRISALLDISELKEKEHIILEQSKMAALGEMIGNIAHQWRQPLSVISSGATGMKIQNEFGHLTDEVIDDTCTLIDNNAQYLSKTIDDFRDFIKGDRKKEVFSLKDNLNSFISLVEGSIKSNNIGLVLDIEDDITINGYPNELIQCFINIFNNSKDALIDIDEENRFLFITTFIENNKAVIVFKDSAGGIPADILPNIFEPYFTTKHKSLGTGLGLHMTYNLIVDGMNGRVDAKNESYKYNGKDYKGALFKITLPLS
ncbi:MAG: transporter substrate-binding domain-containing protein [Campylobacterota bacterium]|nr:transporter substrate-binding domain-containing protein [Campylobacterota bacterium]